MRQRWMLFLFLLVAGSCQGQELASSIGSDTLKVYEYRDATLLQKPSYPGGEPKMMEYLMKNVSYPKAALKKKIAGVVPVSFVVNESGELSDIQVLRDIGGGCGEESVRVVEGMPRWIPGTMDGQPVKVRYTLPIRFKIAR